MLRSPTMNVMQAAARAAARVLKRDFGELENLQVSRKGPGDFTTAADARAEQIICEHLSAARPDYAILAEESGAQAGSNQTFRWIVDPLDGTRNFMNAIPYFAISIALAEDTDIVAGVVYDPIADEMFCAERNEGAYINSRRLRVSSARSLNEAMLACGLPRQRVPASERLMDDAKRVSGQGAALRRMGAAALDLAWLAAGRFDGYWDVALNAWDIAAGLVLLQEAGGTVSDLSGEPLSLTNGEVVAGNADTHPLLLEVLR